MILKCVHFLQICFADFTYSHHPCLSVCVCVRVHMHMHMPVHVRVCVSV